MRTPTWAEQEPLRDKYNAETAVCEAGKPGRGWLRLWHALQVWGQTGASRECQGEDTSVRSTNGFERCVNGLPWYIYFGTRRERHGEEGK